jgi:hypothetical protein
MQLDWRLKSKEIKGWDRQFPVRIEISGEHILTTKVDFQAHENDGSFTLEEMKGFETADYKIKKRLIEIVFLEENPDHSCLVVR